MATATKNGKNAVLSRLTNELEEIKLELRKLVLLIPEESLRGYTDAEAIKASHRRAIRAFPPK